MARRHHHLPEERRDLRLESLVLRQGQQGHRPEGDVPGAVPHRHGDGEGAGPVQRRRHEGLEDGAIRRPRRGPRHRPVVVRVGGERQRRGVDVEAGRASGDRQHPPAQGRERAHDRRHAQREPVEDVPRDPVHVGVSAEEAGPVGRGRVEDDAAPVGGVETHRRGRVRPRPDPPFSQLGDPEDEEGRRRALVARGHGQPGFPGERRAVGLVAHQREAGIGAEDVAVLEARPLVDPVAGVLDGVAERLARPVPPAAGLADARPREPVLGPDVRPVIDLPGPPVPARRPDLRAGEGGVAVHEADAVAADVPAEEGDVPAAPDERLDAAAHLLAPVLVVAHAERQGVGAEKVRVHLEVPVGRVVGTVAVGLEPLDEGRLPVGEGLAPGDRVVVVGRIPVHHLAARPAAWAPGRHREAGAALLVRPHRFRVEAPVSRRVVGVVRGPGELQEDGRVATGSRAPHHEEGLGRGAVDRGRVGPMLAAGGVDLDEHGDVDARRPGRRDLEAIRRPAPVPVGRPGEEVDAGEPVGAQASHRDEARALTVDLHPEVRPVGGDVEREGLPGAEARPARVAADHAAMPCPARRSFRWATARGTAVSGASSPSYSTERQPA